MKARSRTPAQAILLVEDDADIREILSQILEEEGFRVIGAANGREALERLREGAATRLILLDLVMPVMNGWEFREEQRKDASIASIPVIAMSASGQLAADHGDSIGAVAYLTKPVSLETVVETVKKHLAAC